MGRAGHLSRTLLGVFENRDLRRVEFAYASFNAAEWGVWIAMLVYAYARGGATTAGLVAVVQLVPAAVFATLAASLADRYPPKRVLVWAYVAQAAAMGATAGVLIVGGPPFLAYGCAAVAATAVTVTRPAQATLVPSLARTPNELTAANVASGWIESVSTLVAPAAAGVLIGVGGAGTVFAVMAGLVLGGALLVAPVRSPAPPPAEADGPALPALLAAVREPGPRALVWLLGVESLVLGALDVLYVVLAVGILDRSGATAGYLNAAVGAGGVLGVVATVALVGRSRLVSPLLAALLAYAAAVMLVGAAPSLWSAFPLLAIAGAGRSVVDVAGRTLLQRLTRPETLGRVFGLLEAVSTAGLALGSITASALVALAGGRGSFVVMGLALPAALAVVLRSLTAADRAQLPIVELARLRALSLFSPLPRPDLEMLARTAVPLVVSAGTHVVREGDVGDCFYAITGGEFDVTKAGRRVNILSEGDYFGEIALLRDVPRIATVTARTAATLLSLDKASFLTAVTHHAASRAAADQLADQRIADVPLTS